MFFSLFFLLFDLCPYVAWSYYIYTTNWQDNQNLESEKGVLLDFLPVPQTKFWVQSVNWNLYSMILCRNKTNGSEKKKKCFLTKIVSSCTNKRLRIDPILMLSLTRVLISTKILSSFFFLFLLHKLLLLLTQFELVLSKRRRTLIIRKSTDVSNFVVSFQIIHEN